jgi:hypothetical protein
MRNIEYTLKSTSANTQYVTINRDDMTFIQAQFIKYLTTFGELPLYNTVDTKLVIKDYWTKIHKHLPRSKYGMNSPVTFISGLLNNMLYGKSKDFTIHVLPGIELLSNEIYEILQALGEEDERIRTYVEQLHFIQDVRPFTFK